MDWNDEDRKALLAFKENVDSDEIKVKEQIKRVLLNNRFIIHVLNNKELEENEAEPDEYFGENIRPFYMIPETQSETKNFLCYEISSDNRLAPYGSRTVYNSSSKILYITFYILCHQQDIIEKETGIARHDLLAALIQDQFNYTNYFGPKIQLVEDKPSTTDSNYATRTLVFQQIVDSNLVKTKNGSSKLSNKDVITLGND